MLRKFSIMYFLFLCLVLTAEDVKIISSTSNSIVVEYTPTYTDTSITELDGQKFYSVNIYNGIFNTQPGLSVPAVPMRTINIGVPSEFGNTLQVLDTQYKVINGTIIPTPVAQKVEGEIEYRYSVTSDYRNYQPGELATFGDFGLMKELPIQKVILHPVQFDPASNEIKLYTKIRFRVNFGKPVGKTKTISEDLSSVVINFAAAKNWAKAESINKIQLEPQNSVLSSGTWYKFEAPDEGIYKIDRNQLASLGIDAASVDPRTIKIYNNGGYQLNDSVTASRPTDLVENAILVVGEEDGSFDQNDYILFYGRGTDFFEYDPHQNKIVRFKDEFSKENFYFITAGGVPGKRIITQQSLNDPSAIIQTESDAFIYHEENLINVGKSGREYWGEVLNASQSSQTFINSLNSRVPSTQIVYNFRLAHTTSVGDKFSVNFTVQENNNTIYNGILNGWTDFYRFGTAKSGTAIYSGSVPNDMSALKFSLDNPYSNTQANIDYFEIEYRRYLRSVDDRFVFYSDPVDGTIQYNLSNFTSSDINVFDITDYANVKKINPSLLSGGEFRFQAQTSLNRRDKYIALTSSKYGTVSNIQPVSNSNLRGISQGSQYVIIAHKDFSAEAQRLADYRSNESPFPLSSTLIYIDEIYNEFSCGSLDPIAIRDFLVYAYENWEIKPELVLLFGDGDYDYYNVEGKNSNFIPTYQTRESLYELASYPSDDFYSRIVGEDSIPDIGIGRVNVTTSADAEIVVDKIINYETSIDRSLWRNIITLVADDGPTSTGNDGDTHTRQSENLAKAYIPKTFDQKKIYLAAYPTIVTGSGRRKPAVNQAIVDAINNGTLIVNFIGHGNPDVWTHENVFYKDITIPQLQNDNYFFLSAATCDFGRYDEPDDQSGTEIMLLKESSGIIGAFTASRAVYSNLNAALNRIFFDNLLDKKDSKGLPLRLGVAYMYTKATGTIDLTNDEKYILFGDPALRLNQPKYPISIDSINNSNLSTSVQINALGNVHVKGTYRNLDNTVSSFNGEAIISVFDADRRVELKEMNYTMTQQGGLIFRGRVTVTNGKFDASFTVPKDISYQNSNGKVVAYAFNSSSDGVGYTDSIIVGGTDTSSVNDGNGPAIEVYFDDLAFESSYLVNSNFTLLAKLEDETGINTTGSGVGHNLEAIINDDEDNPIDLTSSFVGDLDAGGKSGIVNYKFSNFEEGDYKIRVEAWDVFNNLSSEETFFSVVNSNDLALREVVNYPNPFSSNTTFTFQHNLTKALDVKIKVYTIAGRLIREIEQFNILDKFVRVPWDGRDRDGDELANGTYLYKLIVESTDGEFRETVLGKLAVIR